MSEFQTGTLDFFFPHVGARGFTCESAFSTSVSRGYTLSEQRRQLIGRPKIRMNSQMFANDRNKAHELQMHLLRMGTQRYLTPLFADQSRVTSHNATVINCDTDYRRFEVGKQVAIYARGGAYEVAEITVVGGSSITTDGITGTYTGEVYVVPLVECELLPDQGGVYRFAKYYSASATAIGRVGPMALAPIHAPNANPSGWPTHAGLPVFDSFAHMRHVGDSSWARDGEILDIGLGSIPIVRGVRSVAVYNMRLEFLSRQLAWEYLEFAHSRAGRAYPFWVVSPSEHFTLLNTGTITDEIDVDSIGPIADWASYRTHIGIVEKDGTVTIIDILDTTISRTGDVDTLTLNTPISIPVSDIDRVSVVRKCRYDTDVVDERWEFARDGTTRMRTDMRCTELLEEKDVTIANLTELTTTPKTAGCDANGVALPADGDGPSEEPTYYVLEKCDDAGNYLYVIDDLTTFSHGGGETSWADFTAGETVNLSSSGFNNIWEFLGTTTSNSITSVTVYAVGQDCAKMYSLTPCGGGTVIYTTDDLSAAIGVIYRTSDETCYTVAEVLNTGQTTVSVGSFTVVTGCADAACLPAAPCSCPSGLASSYTITASGLPCSITSSISCSVTDGTACIWDGCSDLGAGGTADISLDTASNPDCFWKVTITCDIGGGDDTARYKKTTGSDPIGTYTRYVDGAFSSFPASVTVS